MNILKTLRSALESDKRDESGETDSSRTYICADCNTTYDDIHRVCQECGSLVVPQESGLENHPYTL